MKKRVPLQVAPEFRDLIRKMQGELMIKGQNKSLRDITLDIVQSGVLNHEEIKKECEIRMDRRRKYV